MKHGGEGWTKEWSIKPRSGPKPECDDMARKFPRQIEMAIIEAKKGSKRTFYLGAVAQRADGTWVKSRNEKVVSVFPRAHAESRLSRKLTPGCTVYVARVTCSGTTAMAKPCRRCEDRLRHVGVKRVVFTTDDGWDSMELT